MILMLATALLSLQFTAPVDTLGFDAAGRARLSAAPVHAYVFYQLDPGGVMLAIPGFADSAGTKILRPHAPGTRETVWLSPGANGRAVTVYVVSLDASGNMSQPSNAAVIGTSPAPAPAPVPLAVRRPASIVLDVPIVTQTPERCGPAALAMVMRYYGAEPGALLEADGAYDPILRGSLITGLAAAARRAGYEAAIETLTHDALIDLVNDGVPPILLYQGRRGPTTVAHFGVVTGWDARRDAFTLQDGGASPHVANRDDLSKRWETAGSQALIVRQRLP
jgi:hypothetical protein